MTALSFARSTIPAFPLGQPLDGRKRFSMTPRQAKVYRWLVEQRQHDHMFTVDFRRTASALGMTASAVHFCVMELVDRGWMEAVIDRAVGVYQFVHPVMTFRAPTLTGSDDEVEP